jgi:hypothetical protein
VQSLTSSTRYGRNIIISEGTRSVLLSSILGLTSHFFCSAYQVGSHARSSTYSLLTIFLLYRLGFWVTMSLTRTVSSRREHVTTNAGGSNLLMCAGGHLRAKYEVSPSSLLTSWRYLILGSAFHRNLCLFCRYCTPIVYMPETMPHVSPIVPGGSC